MEIVEYTFIRSVFSIVWLPHPYLVDSRIRSIVRIRCTRYFDRVGRDAIFALLYYHGFAGVLVFEAGEKLTSEQQKPEPVSSEEEVRKSAETRGEEVETLKTSSETPTKEATEEAVVVEDDSRLAGA